MTSTASEMTDASNFSLAGAPGDTEGLLGFAQPPAFKQIGHLKNKVIKSIKVIMEPFLHASGYNTSIDPHGSILDARRPLLLWVPKCDTNQSRQLFKIEGFLIDDIEGITEFGPIIDTHGGGLVYELFEDLPIEDLLRLHIWARSTFKKIAGQIKRAEQQERRRARAAADDHPNTKPRTS
jgi:hypothetical protein